MLKMSVYIYFKERFSPEIHQAIFCKRCSYNPKMQSIRILPLIYIKTFYFNVVHCGLMVCPSDYSYRHQMKDNTVI